jgi:type II secretory pathway pseudopilin PulG
MRNLDFSSWQGLLSTLVGLAVITLIGVGIRLLLMQTVQQRRERENRQINERLRTLIAAYKTLGGSFTGNLAVDPAHLRDLRRASMAIPAAAQAALDAETAQAQASAPAADNPGTADEESAQAHAAGDSYDRPRRIRDAVEAALADILLLGTEEQVRLAAKAAMEMTQGRPIHTAELVVSLRNFIREVLDLDAVPPSVQIPGQGPARPSGAKVGGGGGNKEGGREGGADAGSGAKGGGGKAGENGGGGGGGGAGAAGAGLAGGLGAFGGTTHHPDEDDPRET